MLNADDPASVLALRRLGKIAKSSERPILLWVGAGASKWLGYPSWDDLARQIRKEFFQLSAGFDNNQAMKFIHSGDFPAVFEMCRSADSARYRKFIADAFAPRQQTNTYKAFVDLLTKINPLFVVTTNVDESLEKNLPHTETLQREDLSRCVGLLQNRKPFVAKLHGSVSSIGTTIFTSSDYASLAANSSYIQALKYLFTGCTVVFLGYGVRDSYVINLLNENSREMELFGPGPHFVVTNNAVPVSSLHGIKYSLRVRPDHSAALSVLDHIIQSVQSVKNINVSAAAEVGASDHALPPGSVPDGKTAYYISDLVPPGTWQTSQEIIAQGKSGEIEGSFGLGFTNDEMPVPVSTALHDIVVGLICFDYVYLPFSVLSSAHNMLGSELFWELVKLEALRFVHNDAMPGAIFHKGEPLGSIGDVTGGTAQGPDPAPLPVLIRRSLRPAPGKEAVAEELFDRLQRATTVSERYKQAGVPSLVRGALLMPAVSRLLGVSDAILPTQVPRWLRYSYLRLAHLVQTAVLCGEYNIRAAKVPFGGVQLTTAAFGTELSDVQAEHLASYVSSGAYNSDLGALIYQDMSIMRRILTFRTSAEGEEFRRETGQALATESGREFNISVNAGLRRAVPTTVLQRAQDRLLTLMTESGRLTHVPAVWGNALRSDTSTRYWRAKSERLLLDLCRDQGIGRNDPCICRSGEKLRLCCLAPLAN